MKQYDTLVGEAAAFAVRAHDGQVRTGTKFPYVVHPLGVGMMLRDYYDNEILEAAGYLHDVVEDTPIGLRQIHDTFGPYVARLVDAVTRKEGWELASYIYDTDVMRLKSADVLDNVIDTIRGLNKGHDVWSRFKDGKGKALYWKKVTDLASVTIFDEPLWRKLNETVAMVSVMAMELKDE